MTALIETRGLTKLYRLVIGVNDVTLTLEPGVHGLLGPNGAGKSTLLKLITGQLRPTMGSIRVLGEVPWNNAPLLRRIGYCPEVDAFYDFMSGLDFVATLARLQGFAEPEARDRAARAMESVGMTEAAHRKISTYSKGMRQRTKIAQALAHDPEFLILDEPLSGTDPMARIQLIELITRLGREGRSILVSSHILHEVQSMTENFMLISSGRVLAAGNVHEIRSLMNEYPHKITVKSDRPAELARALLAEVAITGIEVDKAALTLMTHQPGEFYRKLPGVVLAGGFRVTEISSADDNLESVFKYLLLSGTS